METKRHYGGVVAADLNACKLKLHLFQTLFKDLKFSET
jgi:uncharacterized Fe-S cluster-containing radical SAM superfamily protein